jgi:hypothetical protein
MKPSIMGQQALREPGTYEAAYDYRRTNSLETHRSMIPPR